MRHSLNRTALIVLLAGFTVSCASQLEFPPLGNPLPVSARLEIPASIRDLRADYVDNCGHPMQAPLGTQLEAALVEASSRTFQSVIYEGRGSADTAPQAVVQIELLTWSLEIQRDTAPLQIPATIRLHAKARVREVSGKLLRESDITVTRQIPLHIDPTQDDCAYRLDPFLQETSVEFATKFSLDIRQAFNATLPAKTGAGVTTAGMTPDPSASTPPPSPRPATPVAHTSSLRVTSMVLDENSSLTLESGERFRVRVDVLNTGGTPIQQPLVSLSGQHTLLSLFSTTTLSLPTLQPGEMKSVEFLATLPPAIPSNKAELRVHVEESTTHTQAPTQTLAITIRSTGVKTDDVDQIPASASDFRQPHTYLISIGISSYRDPQILPRKFASLDAEMVANYFQSLGGLPASNVRLFQDWNALRPDIEEALLNWLPPHMTKDALVIVYFSGQVMVNQDGEVLLVPYEGSPTATTRLYPLKDLESALSRLKANHTILLFDGMVSRLHSNPKARSLPPRWDSSGSSTIRLISSDTLSKGLEDDTHRHGLFTYHLLRALRGEADSNRDGAVTLGEVAGYVSQKVIWASKSQLASEQHPFIFPPMKSDNLSSTLILSKPAAIRGEDAP